MPKPSDPSKHTYMFSDDMKILQKVVILHPDDKNKFLILKRGMAHHYRPGDWDLAGGNVIFGEDVTESVLREVKEETGMGIENLKPIQVSSMPQFEGTIYLLIINYIGDAQVDTVGLSDEHTEYKWVTNEEFSSMTSTQFLLDLIDLAFREYR